jgi:peptidoglycan/LPS O-acetylase OafA/YrhL
MAGWRGLLRLWRRIAAASPARGLPTMAWIVAPIAALALVYALALPVQRLPWTLFLAMVFLPCVLILAVAAGRHAAVPGGAWLGRISYPLYGIHVPLLAIVCGAAKRLMHGAPLGLWGLALVPPLLLAAWLVLTRIDEPCCAARWLDQAGRPVPQPFAMVEAQPREEGVAANLVQIEPVFSRLWARNSQYEWEIRARCTAIWRYSSRKAGTDSSLADQGDIRNYPIRQVWSQS